MRTQNSIQNQQQTKQLIKTKRPLANEYIKNQSLQHNNVSQEPRLKMSNRVEETFKKQYVKDSYQQDRRQKLPQNPLNIRLNNNQFLSTQFYQPSEDLDSPQPDFYQTQQYQEDSENNYYNPFTHEQNQFANSRQTMRNYPQQNLNSGQISRSRSPNIQQRRLTQEQIERMSVDQIIQLSNQTSTHSRHHEQAFSERPTRQFNPQNRNQRSLSGHSGVSQFSQQQFYPTPSYEDLIENKVFTLLQNYFNPKQTNSQQNSYHTQNMQQHSEKIELLQKTMGNMNEDIQKMRKFIQDLHISVTEKDAEIVKLKMNLSDDVRTKQNIRSTKKQSLNESRDACASNQVSILAPDHDLLDRLQEENTQLKEQIQEQRDFHQQEIAQLQAQIKSSQNIPNTNSSETFNEQERIIATLREDCLRMQEEVSKALKIHKANKTLQEKQTQYKQDIERLKRDLKCQADEKDERINELNNQIEKLQAELIKARNSSAIGVQRRQSVQQQDTTKINELQAQIERMTIEMNSNKTNGNQALEQKLQAAQQQNAKLQQKIKDLENGQMGNDLALQAELAQQKEDFETQEANYKKQISRLENQVAEKNQVVAQLQQSMSQISEMVSEKETKIGQLETQLKKSDDAAKEMKKQIDGLGQQVMKDCEMITAAQEQESKAKSEIVGLKKMITTLTQQLAIPR